MSCSNSSLLWSILYCIGALPTRTSVVRSRQPGHFHVAPSSRIPIILQDAEYYSSTNYTAHHQTSKVLRFHLSVAKLITAAAHPSIQRYAQASITHLKAQDSSGMSGPSPQCKQPLTQASSSTGTPANIPGTRQLHEPTTIPSLQHPRHRTKPSCQTSH